MKQLRGSFLTPGGSLPRLGTPTFITFRPFRRFSTLKNNSKVIFKFNFSPRNDSRFVEKRRRVSTDGPKKSQCSTATNVVRKIFPSDSSQFCEFLSGSCRAKRNNSPFDLSSHQHELTSIADSAETKHLPSPFSLDPLVVLESAFLPSFHHCNDELLNSFQTDRPRTCSVEWPGDNWQRLTGHPTTERRVKKQVHLPRHAHPLTFETVHKFDDNVDDKDPTKTDLDLPNLPNLPSGPLIFPSGRSSQIIHKDLYITNRILEKIKEKETKERNEDGVKIPDPTVKACSATEGNRRQIEPNAQNRTLEEQLTSQRPKTAPSALDVKAPSIVEFKDLSPDHNFTEAEAQSIDSRKKFYELLNATVPCCLVDGLHVENVQESNVDTEQQISNRIEDDLLVHVSEEEQKMLDSIVKQLNDLVSQDADLVVKENCILPVDEEMESMILALVEKAHSDVMSVSNANIENVDQCTDEIDALSSEVDQIAETKDEFPWPIENVESTINPTNDPSSKGSCRNYSSSPGEVPPKKTNAHIDIKTETTIKCTRSGDKTNINIVEVQKYLDKRLPYPFSTETILQVFGSNDSLRPATQTIENSKAQLVHLSNANSPNPGMLIPKLQFNHMLSKTHDLSKMSASDKKRSLKINVVPGPSKIPYPSVTISLTDPSSPSIPSQMSKIVDTTGGGGEIQEATNKSKIIYKSGKKSRRRETLTKFRPKKTVQEEAVENIKILSPRELDKMFPSPPKPKLAEVPRTVTVNTTAANDSKRTVEVPPIFTPSISPKIQTPPINEPPIPPLRVDKEQKISDEVSKAKMYNLIKRDEVESRNEINLKTLISGQMKDSYLSVSKRDAKTLDNTKNVTLSPEPKALEFPKNAIEVEKTPPKITKGPKTGVDSKVLEAGFGKPHPTPLDKRQYISIGKHSDVGKPNIDDVNKLHKKAKDETILPLSAKEAIANVMKNTENSYNPEYRLIDPPLENPYKIKPGKEVESIGNPAPQKPDMSKRFSHPPKQNFHSVYDNLQKTEEPPKNNNKPAVNTEVPQDQTQASLMSPSFTGHTRATAQPLFFPYETPTVKESIYSTPLDSLTNTNPIHIDFCKECKEMNPSLECLPLQCKVPLKRVKKFPMINVAKTVGYNVPKEGAITISHDTNMMLKKTLTGVPAVTKILGATLSERSQKALDRWKQGLLASLGEEGFKVFYENQLRQGSEFHNLVGKFLLRGTDTVEKHDDPCLKSLKHVFSNISDVGVIESQVVHPQLAYRGVVDCVAKYKGKPVVIEWKRSDRAKPSVQHTYDAPLQLSAYIGAMNYDSNYGLQVNGGVVIVAHSDGSPADVFELSLEECEHYWLQWLKRLHQYFIQEPSKGIV